MAQLHDDIIELLNDNTKPMIANFTKIVSWLKNGQESEHKMPPKVLEFLEAHAKTVEQTQEIHLKVETLANIVETLNTQLAETTTAYNDVAIKLNDAMKRVGELETALEAKDTPKKRGKKSDTTATETPTEPVSTPAEHDEVELTAAAVGAGEVSSAGLSEIADMIDNALGDVNKAVLSTGAPKATAMDEL